jgi:deoxyhypusine synthase
MASFRGLRKVEDLSLEKKLSVGELVGGFGRAGGFTAKKLSVGADILVEMFSDDDYVNFLSFPAAIVATGTRGVIAELVKRKLFDVVVTTCGTLDHDLARVWRDYFHGHFIMDDRELRRKGVNRLGNILVPDESYGLVLEEKMQLILSELYEDGMRETSGYELVWEFGRRVRDRRSILYWAYRNKIPVIVPGILDGAFGSQLFFFSQGRDFKVNLFRDQKLLADIVFKAKKTGALMVGGGISKHHTIWWNQFKGGLDRVVYLTSAPEWDGSLSGARIREAVSWGKVNAKARYVTVEGDATINLPIMVAAALEKLS